MSNLSLKYNGKIFAITFVIFNLYCLQAFSQTLGPSTTFSITSSTTSNGGSATGNVTGASGGSGTFSITETAYQGSNGIVWTGTSTGIQAQCVEPSPATTGSATSPNTVGYNFSVTATSGSVKNTTLTRWVTSNPIGNSEPETIKITWLGGGSATLSDPSTQFVSAPSTFLSGTTLTFLGSGHASVTNDLNKWKITIPSNAFSISVTALANHDACGCNYDFSNEWFVFDAEMSSISLPITGVELNTSLENKSINLHWQSLTEINSKEFEIQKCNDGINFITISKIAAAGNSNSPVNYSYNDNNYNNDAKLFYRLKLVDLNGNYSYSNVAVIRLNQNKGIKVFPTEFSSQTKIEFTNNQGIYIVSLINPLGQVVQMKQINVSFDKQYININKPSKLPNGVYIISIKKEGTPELYTQKVFIK